jgi:hypothetical protein
MAKSPLHNPIDDNVAPDRVQERCGHEVVDAGSDHNDLWTFDQDDAIEETCRIADRVAT